MDSLQAAQQPRLSAEPMDAGDVFLIILCAAYMLAAMAGSVYLACDGEARMSVLGFIALWLRELLLMAILAVGLLVAAAMKVVTVVSTWLRPRERQEVVR